MRNPNDKLIRVCFDVGSIWDEAVTETKAFFGGDMGRAFTYAPGTDVHGNPLDKPPAATLPDPNAAAQTALDAQNKDRRALLASGGKTDLTGGSGMLLGSDINSLNLGGS